MWPGNTNAVVSSGTLAWPAITGAIFWGDRLQQQQTQAGPCNVVVVAAGGILTARPITACFCFFLDMFIMIYPLSLLVCMLFDRS
jgi:hypothetical protein